MIYKFMLCFTGFFIISGCDGYKVENTAPDINDNISSYFTENSVWKGNVDKCFTNDDFNDCLINEIKKSGRAEAEKTAQYLYENGEAGYVSSFSKMGAVGIARVEYPFRANTNEVTFLIPASGKLVDIDNLYEDLKLDAIWRTYKKNHPGSSFWSPALIREIKHTKDGCSLIFSYPIKTCHACEEIASLYVSYMFTSEGDFFGSKVLAIK